MKAKLVRFTFVRRVVVEDTATYNETLDAAIAKIRDLDDLEMRENADNIEDDLECPFDPEIDV